MVFLCIAFHRYASVFILFLCVQELPSEIMCECDVLRNVLSHPPSITHTTKTTLITSPKERFFMLNVKTCVICKCNMAQLITRPQLDLRSQMFWTIFSAEYRDALFVPATFIFTNYNLKPEYKLLWLLELRRLKEKIFAAAKCQRLNFFLLILHFATHLLPPRPLINCLRWATV